MYARKCSKFRSILCFIQLVNASKVRKNSQCCKIKYELVFTNLNYFNLHFYLTHLPFEKIIECNDQNENNMIYLQKSTNNYCKKYCIFGRQDFFCINVIYSICNLNRSESHQTEASHSDLDIMNAPMWDNEQFICFYCKFKALKLEANNVNKY